MRAEGNEQYTVDGMLRLAGAVIRQAIVDGHPASRRVRTASGELAKEVALHEQREAQFFVIDIFHKDAKRLALIERYWSLPWDAAKMFFREAE